MKTKTMVKTYYPQSVDLPPGIERNILSADDINTVKQYKYLPENKKRLIDTHTLFYDIFFIPHHLVCVGPPFYGFGNLLSIRHKGKKLKFKIYPRYLARSPSVILIHVDQPRSYDLEFVFQSWTIKVSYIYRPFPLSKAMLTMVTLQNDNPLIWIKDWCLYHSKAYGVEQIFLYDNGSKYWTDLAEALTDLDENLEIVLVNWPYKYGYINPGVIVYYQYCQIGALQHYCLAFGSQTKWCINLDIDEYLYLNNNTHLKSYLASKAAKSSVLSISHYRFPMGQVRGEQPRFYYGKYRYRTGYFLKSKNSKYIYQPTKVLTVDVHDVESYYAKLLLKTIIYKLANQENYIRLVTLWRRVCRLIGFLLFGGKRRQKRYIFNDNKKKSNPLYFFHFSYLYTGWAEKHNPGAVKFRNINTIPKHQLVSDTRVIEKAIEIGIIKQSDIPSD